MGALAPAAAACALDWPPPLEATQGDGGPPDGGPPDADADAPDGETPSDCEACAALAAHARPDAPPAGATHEVAGGDDLQAVLDAAAPGDEIVLEAGATFAGTFYLPPKTGDGWITVRTSDLASLPGPCTRLGPEHLATLPKLIGPAGEAALVAADGAHHYRLLGVELTIEPGPPFPEGIVVIGLASETNPDLIPHHIELDRVFLHGDPAVGSYHGLLVHGGETKLLNSRVTDIKSDIQQAIGLKGYNGPGPLFVLNDWIESAGPQVHLGGHAPAIGGQVITGVEVRFCDLTRPAAWDPEDPSYDGSAWKLGNAVDLFNTREVTVEGNRIDNVAGHVFVLEAGSEGAGGAYGVVQDVTIGANAIWGSTGSMCDLRAGDAADPALGTQRIHIVDNLGVDLGGRILELPQGIAELELSHNTVLQAAHIFFADGVSTSFSFVDNIVNHNAYGMWCNGTGWGTSCLEALFPGYEVRKNVIVGLPMTIPPSDYPPDNFFPAYTVGFVDPVAGDYHLADSSPYRGMASDGTDIGVRFAAHDAAAACRSVRR